MRFKDKNVQNCILVLISLMAVSCNVYFVIQNGFQKISMCSGCATLLILVMVWICKIRTLLIFFYTLYALVLVAVQFPSYALHSESNRNVFYYVPKYIMENPHVHVFFVTLIVLNFAILMVISSFVENHDVHPLIRIHSDSIIFNQAKVISAFVASQICYVLVNVVLKYTTFLDWIPHVRGVVFYSFEATSFYLLIYAYDYLFKREFDFRLLIELGGITILKGIPSLINGSKSPMIFALAIMIIMILWNEQIVIKKSAYGVIIGLGIIGVCSIEVGNYFRTGEWMNLFSWIAVRITGYPDDAQCIYHVLVEQKPTMGLFSYLTDSFHITNGISEYYTRDFTMMNYELTSAARTGLGSALLYSGISGVVSFSVVANLVLSLLEKKAVQCTKQNSACYIYAYLFFYILVHFVMEGSIDGYKIILLPILGAGIIHIVVCFIERMYKKINARK